MAHSHQRRIMLWAYPRTLSSVLELSLASRAETKVFHELYSLATYFGDDRIFEDATWTVPGYTMKDVTETLEGDYPESDVILCKDLACCLGKNYDSLPKGYVHTFLIRDPRRSISSLCKIHNQLKIPAHMFPSTGGVKQLHDLHNYVTNTLDQKSIIIDAGDLAKEAEKTIRKYCEAVEIPYSDSYLNWTPNNIDHWHAIWKDTALEAFFGDAVGSTHFKPLHDRDKDQEMDISDVPHQGQLHIEDALPYYNELFEKRLQP